MRRYRAQSAEKRQNARINVIIRVKLRMRIYVANARFSCYNVKVYVI